MASHSYPLSPGLRVLFRDLGLDAGMLLREADLPQDLFARARPLVTSAEYFRLWNALERSSTMAELPLAIGQRISVESFDPTLFAALCSPNLASAFERLSAFKRLIGPMELALLWTPEVFAIELRFTDLGLIPPPGLALAELVFFVQLARMGTREAIVPASVITPSLPAAPEPYAEYFGVELRRGDAPSLRFHRVDAERPLLTANASMWAFFEPELQRRLADLTPESGAAERVRAALVELLPSGHSGLDDVAKKLGTSKRTLQRRLHAEGSAFQAELDRTRASLATHYLRHSAMSGPEIAFLLGYEDPNSFIRAFNAWTGRSPEQFRSEQRESFATGG